MELKVASAPSQELAMQNCAFLNPSDAEAIGSPHIELGPIVLKVSPLDTLEPGKVALNGIQRRSVGVGLNDVLRGSAFPLPRGEIVRSVDLNVEFVSKSRSNPTVLRCDRLSDTVIRRFRGQVLTKGQQVLVDFEGTNTLLRVDAVTVCDIAGAEGDEGAELGDGRKAERGVLESVSEIEFNSTAAKCDWGERRAQRTRQLFVSGFNFADLGIGGLDSEFSDIFRRAFASRVFSAAVVDKLGIKHVRGILLHGPPGTGKTLIARQIGKMLNAREPKIVSGPSILNKYVGESESNIRALFADAEAEQKEMGEESGLHIIIFDEIDAICKQRGTTGGGTGVGDTVVNQLLAKMDGVDSLNNVLVIGMTNRKDMIDEALLRPGRLEVHCEIGLPDEEGRHQILMIHTAKMRDNNFIDRDVDLAEIAKRIKNFSGADIDGLCRSAASYAFGRQVDVHNVKPVNADEIRITRDDFDHAISEVQPTYGVNTEDFDARAPSGMISYGPRFAHLMREAERFVTLVRDSERTPLLSFLLEGPVGTGKTALAATVALESQFPLIKLVSAESFVGATEQFKVQRIAKVFEDAYKTPLSCVVLDDLERLVEYVPMGPRFSNPILQAILVSLKRVPPRGRRILIVATTSSARVLQDMQLYDAFTAALHVPKLGEKDEIESVLKETGAFHRDDLAHAVDAVQSKIGIKKLLTVVEMAKEGRAGKADLEAFIESLTTLDC